MLLRRLRAIGILAAAMIPTIATLPVMAADLVGIRSLAVPVPARHGTLTATIWYPALPGGTPAMIGESKIFVGVSASKDAPLAAGSHPLILLSEGGLRSAPNLGAWLAADLAARGFIVVTAPPPDLTADKVQSIAAEIWLRPADLSASLDAVLGDPVLSRRIIMDRVAVLGMQLGGTSALALAGARLDPDSYRRSCDQGGVGLDCSWFARNGVDLHKLDGGALARSHFDPRIKAIVAIDPEQTKSFTPASLGAINVPVAIINLGAIGQIAPALDASQMQQQITDASYATLADATQFSGFSSCTTKGTAILRAEGEDERICQDDGKHPRDEIHHQLASRVAAFLERNLELVSAAPMP
jgi:predicted dienelactone hydrolase